jgi:HAD superfamily hydrolase (TIGR01459 family)
MTPPTPIAIDALLARYDGVLLDVYGVLLDAGGVLPGARELLAELARRALPYAIVTNDASRSATTYARRFERLGLAVAADRIVTSGSLIPAYVRDHGLAGARACVLGTADSLAYVAEGGARPIPPGPGIDIDALVICDDAGFEFLAGLEHALSAVVRAIDAGRTPALVLPNPDLIYPKSPGELGFTAGAMALLVEAALARRFPALRPSFVPLGKPQPHLFAHAARQLAIAPDRLVMIGDQLETDIAGARAAGIDAALLAGISRWDASATATVSERGRAPVVPTYLLTTLAPTP